MKYHNSYLISLCVFLVSLLITGIMWRSARQTLSLKEEARFIQETQEIEDVMKYRLDEYSEALFGVRSVFATVAKVSRQNWNAYCESLELRKRTPGLLSLRFDTRSISTEQAVLIEKGRTDSKIEEVARPTEVYVVTYIWPWDQYQELYGLDMFSVAERRYAIEAARDSGSPAITSKITSVLEQSAQNPGFVMYLPVYRSGAPTATVAERRSAIQGVVAARFNAYDLIEHTLRQLKRYSQIDIEVFDGTVLTAEHLYYNNDGHLQAHNGNSWSGYAKTVTMELYGQSWTVFFSSKPGFRLAATEVSLPWIALGTGIIVSLLLSGIILALTTSQIRATQMAERMTRELENQRALSMRSDRLRSLGEMAAGIAHELNQPLVGVRGLAEHILIAQDRGWNFTAQTIREKVATIIEQADRMALIIEHIRIFAREAGKPELRPINVNDVIASGTNLISAQFASHGLTIKKELAADLPPVYVNPFTLEEVVLNLLTNARDAVEERLHAEPAMPTPGVRLCTRTFTEHGRSMVSIAVSDNGVGIPPEIQEKIFDPFFTTKPPDKGTGLGLSISKTILEECGGILTIRSKPTEGTTAIITLPAEDNHGTDT